MLELGSQLAQRINQLLSPVREKSKRALLYNYLSKTGQLDFILENLTKHYCKSSCSNGPIGCCGQNFYSVDSVKELLSIQQKEALDNGLIYRRYNHGCIYHDFKKGCYLVLSKSPLCLGGLCSSINLDLIHSYGTNGCLFVHTMNLISHADLTDSGKLFLQMDKAIELGDSFTTSN